MHLVRVSSSKHVEVQPTTGHFTQVSFRILINITAVLAEKLVYIYVLFYYS
jgi:hypothetical protein